MGIFSLFKKRTTDPPPREPAAILGLTLQYVPEFYHESQHYKDCVEFLQHREWGLALDSIIEMADESGHYFSETFWLDLSECANSMKQTQEASYCRQQIARNERELSGKTPNGWTTVKIDDTHFEHKIAQIVEDEWEEERHQKDKVHELMKIDGFHKKSFGRGGTIYYVDHGRLLEIGIEGPFVAPYSLMLYFDGIKSWTIPKGAPFTVAEQAIVRAKLEDWLKVNAISVEW